MPKYIDPFANAELLAQITAEAAPAPVAKPEGAGAAAYRTVGDVSASIGSGAGNLLQGVGTFLAGSDSAVAEAGGKLQAYMDRMKSTKLKAQEAESAAIMADPDKGMLDAAGYVASHPYLAANMAASSAPSMLAGAGAGGLVAKGMGTLGLMTEGAGALTSMGTRVAGGVGEGLVMVPDVYQNTQGSGEASMAGLALGVVTSMVTPGNIGAAVARKVSGAGADVVETAFNKTVARRVGGAVAGEAAQEFGQEGGQALVEQAGRGEDFNLNAAGKQAAVGAVLGGVMGGGMHPLVGEGAPHGGSASADPLVQLQANLSDANAALAANPTNPVLQAEVSVANARLVAAARPNDATELLVRSTEANLAAARDPDNRALRDEADMASAATSLHVAGSEGSRNAADIAQSVSHDALASATTADEALTAFAAGEQAGSVLRVTTAGIENTMNGIAEGSHLYAQELAEADIARQTAEDKARKKETKLAAEIERARAPAAPTFASREAVSAYFDPKIAAAEADAIDERRTLDEQKMAESAADKLIIDRNNFMSDFPAPTDIALNVPAQSAVQSPAQIQMADAYNRAQDTSLSAGERETATNEFIRWGTKVNAEADAAAYAAGGRYLVSIDPNNSDEINVIGPTGTHYDTYTGPAAAQDAAAAANTLNAGLAPVTAPAPTFSKHLTSTRNAMLAAGYAPGAVEGVERYTDSQLNTEQHDLRLSPERRALAHALLIERSLPAMTVPQFNAREAELEAAIGGRPNRRDIEQNMMRFAEDTLREYADNPSHTSNPLARIALAFRQGVHLGNVDSSVRGRVPAQAQANPREIAARLAASREANVSTGGARTSASSLMRDAAREVAAESRPGVRVVEPNFRRRTEAALADGSIKKLAAFFRSVMGGVGQRVLTVDTSDLRGIATQQTVTQVQLNSLKDRYNAAFKAKAIKWAQDNNRPVPSVFHAPIESIRGAGGEITLTLRGLGRRGANPYLATGEYQTGTATISQYDHHMTTTQLRNAPGSSDLAYRLGAELGSMLGFNVPASDTLLTNNRFRRQVQSVFNDSAVGVGRLSPVTVRNDITPQGVPGDLWANANQEEKAGINLLRVAHQLTENRTNNSDRENLGLSRAQFLENLQFNSAGKIVAASEPKYPSGWPKGTVVSDEMLLEKLISQNATDRTGEGGVGLDTAKLGIMINTAMLRVEGKPNATIPQSLVTKARVIGRDMGGWMFSEDTPKATGITPITAERANTRVQALLGDKVGKFLTDSGIITFVGTQTELVGKTFSDAAGRIQGATTRDGRVMLVLENLSEATFDGVLLHEGTHSTLKPLIGEETYGKLMTRLDVLLRGGAKSAWAIAANARVPAGTPDANRLEEVACYAVELATNGSQPTNPLARWGKDFMSALRAGIIRSKLVPEDLRDWALNNLQAQDLSKLAIAGLRAKAVGTQTSTKLSEWMRSAQHYADEIEELMGEHRAEDTTGPRRAEINTKVAKLRTAWRVAEEAEYEVGRNSEGASYGVPQDGAVSVQGVHFSGEQRDTLSTSAYGKGLAGAEARRLNEPENADIKARTHFYVDEGHGVSKEAGVGAYGHMVQLNNLYDIKADKLGIWAAARGDVSAQERAVVDAGFDGFYAPGYDGKQGAAVVIGDHTIPTEPYAIGTNVSARAEPARNDYADNLGKSKLPAGQMNGREWMVALKGGEFDTPAVRAALEQRQDELIYRDDLPRFNDGARYSIAQEQEITGAPVAKADPNEMVVVGRRKRAPMARVLESFREGFQQKHVTLGRIQQLFGVTAEHTKLDTIGSLDRLGSKLMSRQQELVMQPLARMETVIEQGGYDGNAGRAELDEFLIMRHVAEYNAHIAQINPARYADVDGTRTYVGGFDAAHPGSGRTDEAAQVAIDKVLASAKLGGKKAKALLEAETIYRKMISDIQDHAVEMGLEKAGTIEVWREKFANYTPFNRDLDIDDNTSVGSIPGSQGFSLRSGLSRRAMGSKADIASPLVSTALLGMKTTTRGANAEVARTMLSFAEAFVPNFNDRGTVTPMWVVNSIPSQRVVKAVNVYQTRMADGNMSPEFYNRDQARDYADAQQEIWVAANPHTPVTTSGIVVQRVGNGPQNRVIVQPVPMPLNMANVMVIPVKGENKMITFNEKSQDAMAILNALKNKDGNAAKYVPAIFRMWSRLVVATSTGFNPVFMFFNSPRDVGGAMLSLKGDKIPGWTTKDSLGIAKNFFPAVASIWSQGSKEFRALHSNTGPAPEPTQGSYAWWANEARALGGLTGVASSMVDTDTAETQLRRLFGQDELTRHMSQAEANDWLSKSSGMLIKTGDAFARFAEGETKAPVAGWVSRHIVSAIGRMNEATETTTRTLAFKAASEKFMEAGHSQEVAMAMAANISKNVSTNFNRRGNYSSLINQLFPFFNAALQGSARLAEVMFENETYKTTKDGVVEIDQRTKFTKFGKSVVPMLVGLGAAQAVMLAMAGFDDDDLPQSIKDRAFIVPLPGKGNYAAIPMPHGFNVLINFGREMADAGLHPDKAAQHVGMATIGQLGNFNPFGGGGDNVLLSLTPALLDIPVALYMNKDAFGRPIAKETMNPAAPTPGFTRAKEGATAPGKRLAEGLNTLTGGNEDQSGSLSPTPDQIDYVVGQITGGVGREVSKVGALVTAGAQDLAGIPRETMPISRIPLIGRLGGSTDESSAIRAKLFATRTELNEKYARFEGLRDRGETAQADAFWKENPELQYRKEVERFALRDAKQRKRRALARTEGDVAEVNRITEQQDVRLRDVMEDVAEAKKSK